MAPFAARGFTIGSLLATLLLAASNLWCQAQSGTVVGTVSDQTGAAVPGARVTLVNTGTNFSRIVQTNSNGQYVADTIPTGSYKATVEAAGFQKLVRSGIELTAGDTLTVDLRLALGSVQETVEVTARAPLLQSQTATVSNLVTNRQMLALPMNGRTFTSLVLLTPGAYVGSSNNLSTSPYALRGSTNISVNGSSAQNNSYVIDGLFNRNLWLNTLIMVPTVDSIQEFRVFTSNYSAEYGAAAGAVTIVQTKSGTNELHGRAYEFLRNDKLDANTFFNNRQGLTRPPFRRNEFGGTLGGPIRRNKTFVFADYQGIRLREPRTIVSTIPTLQEQAMVRTGDFSALGATVFDPNTLHPDASGRLIRDPFPGNRILPERLDPAAVRLINLLPSPTSPAATANFTFDPRHSQRTDQFDVRLDQNVGAADRLFLKYSFDDSIATVPGSLPSPVNSPVPIGPFLSIGGDMGTTTPLRNQSVTLDFVKVISPATVNETRLGLVRWSEFITPLDTPFKTADALGIPGININDKTGGLPAFLITGFQGIGDSSTFPENSQTTTFQYEDVLTLVRGSQALKFGGIFLRHRFDGFSAFPVRGTYNFNGQFTRQVGATGTQTALADFALGIPSGVTRNILSGTFGMRLWELAAFADDSWRVTNRLTWNFGLRYELFAPPYEVHDHWSNFNLATGQLLVAGLNGNDRRLRNFDADNFSPRMGLAYVLTSDHKTVLRSGFGVSYVQAGQGGGQLYKNLPFFFSQVIATDQNGLPPLRISDGLPTPAPPDINNSDELSSGNPNAWDFNLQSTKAMQWSMGIQRELRTNLLLDVSYVGTRTLGLISNYNYNQAFPGPGAPGPRRPLFPINPRVTDVTYRSNYGAAKYHSLQARAEKRYSQGLTLTVSYTYSKYLSNAGNINGGGNGPPQDARCLRCEWGPMPEDRRHVMVINHVYELPFGSGRKYVHGGSLAHLLGGWNVSGIWSISSGTRFTPTLAGGVSNAVGGGGERPDRLRDGNLPASQRTIDHWFDVDAFRAPQQFTFGNAARGILVAPGNFNVDLGVHRNVHITDRFDLSFRWEMFNAFNRANFSEPSAQIGNRNAGQISSTGPARIMQVALKLTF